MKDGLKLILLFLLFTIWTIGTFLIGGKIYNRTKKEVFRNPQCRIIGGDVSLEITDGEYMLSGYIELSGQDKIILKKGEVLNLELKKGEWKIK